MRAAQRRATAFQVELRASLLQQALVAGLVLLAVAAAIAAFAAHDSRCWWLFLLTPLPTWLAWTAAAGEPRHLQWDGQTWRLARGDLHEPDPAVEVDIAIDLGHWLLPLSRARVGASWRQLRATLYSARPHDPTVDEPR